MSEGRKTQVILLDDRRLDLLVQPKLYSMELLDIVASHFNLKEKEYFGISFKDETGHHHWLHLDRKVLEHEFSKKAGPLVLYFGVRFFIESIGYLRDNSTIELFYLQAKQAIFKAFVEVDSDSAFELAAHVLQASFGDHFDDDVAKKHLKKLPVLPTSVLREYPSLGYCEEKVLGQYKKLEGQTRGSAIVNYMTIVENLPTYGIHYYEVKDKSGIPWWLGLSYKGISLYDYADKRVPRRVFAWKQLENLYFRAKKFSIEVHDPKRIVHTLSSFNLYEDAIQEPIEEFDDLSDAISDPTTQVSVSRRTFGPGNVNVHAWFAATPQLTKCIWSMAVSQHQFYLDRKQSKSQLPAVRSMSEIATDLCHSSNSLHSSSQNSDCISRSNSSHSLTLSTYNSKTEITFEDIEASHSAQRDMLEALEARKRLLEDALKKKTEELKAICLKEGELTGILPKETPLAPGEPMPQIRRRIGTSFALSPKIFNRDKTTEANEALARLELDLDLQDKITKAAYRLAQDKSVAKSVRKQRKQQYHKSHQKLKDIEKKLNEYRAHIGKIPVKVQNSMEDLSEDSREFLDSESEFISPINSPAVNREVGTPGSYNSHLSSPCTPHMKIIASPKVQYHSKYTGTHGNTAVTQHKSAPASPVRHVRSTSDSQTSTSSPNTQRYRSGTGGYIPNSVYSTRTSYRDQTYPTYSTKDQGSDYENSSKHHVSRIDHENYRNGVQNLYNINTKKTAYYDSADELKSPETDDYDSYCSDVEGERWRYGGEGTYGQQTRGYGSLDRNTGTRDVQLSELSPSKFGSKRESHSDYRDSPYQIVDMPPITRPETLLEVPSISNLQDSSSDLPNDSTSHNTSIPYIDCSQSTISVNSNPPSWYGGKDSGNGPQYESPPPQFVRQEYERGYSHSGYDPQGHGHGHAPQGHPSHPHPQSKTTVTKYQSYVEVSKPFEMSDFYKYSERLRRQRVQESPPSSVGSGSTPQSPHHPPGAAPAPPIRTQRQPSQGVPQGGPGSYTPQGQYRPSSRSRPTSPFQQYDTPNATAYAKQSSPYSPAVTPSYQGAPPPPGAQSSLIHTAYPHMTQQHSTPYPSHSPKHMAYQPPKPMTCQPVCDSPQQTNVNHRYMDDSENQSFGSFNMGTEGTVAQAFSEEMLAWYDDKEESPPPPQQQQRGQRHHQNPYTLV